MKRLFFALTLFAFACSQNPKSNENRTEMEESPEVSSPEETEVQSLPYSQVVIQIDTMVTGDVVKEIISYQSFDGQNLNFVEYSVENPDGNAANSTEDLWMISLYDEYASAFPGAEDTTIVVSPDEYNETVYRFDEFGNLVQYKDFLYEINTVSDATGRTTKMKIGVLDERSGLFDWFIVDRNYTENLPEPESYLTINDQNIFEKEKKSILDYYLLMTASEVFQPEQSGGLFDIPNGYFEISDEGTGAGTYISQLVLFRKNDGTDILALASRAAEPVDYVWVSSQNPPRFYTFTGSGFEKLEGIFPELDKSVFLSEESGDFPVQTYYVLPQKGLSITYNLNYNPVMDYCEKRLDDLEDNMSPEDFAKKKKQCEVFSQLEKTSVSLAFNKETGRFEMQ